MATNPLHFNPRAPCGARRRGGAMVARYTLFQPTRPLRGATKSRWYTIPKSVFQPTRPLRGATYMVNTSLRCNPISTHAPLAGRDDHRKVACGALYGISTHAPLAGRDARRPVSARAYTRISTHAPLAGRDQEKSFAHSEHTISTHAPLAGRDLIRCSRRR